MAADNGYKRSRRAHDDIEASIPAPASRAPGTTDTGVRPVLLAGRYRIDGLIGQGGMARVHAAHDLLLKRDVAITLFRPRPGTAPDFELQQAEAHLVAGHR